MAKSLLQRFWTELTRVRKIEFISYETEEEMRARLNRENYEIKKLTNWVIDSTLYKENYLIPEHEARERAMEIYYSKGGI